MSGTKSERLKKRLGMNFSTAHRRLVKSLLFKYVGMSSHIRCDFCRREITHIDDFTIEHRLKWRTSDTPVEDFFNLDQIRFAHSSCNRGERRMCPAFYSMANQQSHWCRDPELLEISPL